MIALILEVQAILLNFKKKFRPERVYKHTLFLLSGANDRD